MSMSATPGGAVGCTSTGSALGVDRRPDRRERRIGQRPAVDVGEHHHAGRAGRMRAIELGQRDAPGTATAATRTSASRSGCAVCAAAMSSFMIRAACRLTSGPPQNTFGTGERHDADVDAARVHRLQAQVVVEHRRHRRHERRAVEMDRAQAAAPPPSTRVARTHRAPAAAANHASVRTCVWTSMTGLATVRSVYACSSSSVDFRAGRP